MMADSERRRRDGCARSLRSVAPCSAAMTPICQDLARCARRRSTSAVTRATPPRCGPAMHDGFDGGAGPELTALPEPDRHPAPLHVRADRAVPRSSIRQQHAHPRRPSRISTVHLSQSIVASWNVEPKVVSTSRPASRSAAFTDGTPAAWPATAALPPLAPDGPDHGDTPRTRSVADLAWPGRTATTRLLRRERWSVGSVPGRSWGEDASTRRARQAAVRDVAMVETARPVQTISALQHLPESGHGLTDDAEHLAGMCEASGLQKLPPAP